jgi:hypothetical protein
MQKCHILLQAHISSFLSLIQIMICVSIVQIETIFSIEKWFHIFSGLVFIFSVS